VELLGYARVSTVKQNLDRQIDALEQVGIPRDRIYVDRKSGATTDRPVGSERSPRTRARVDVIVVHTLDRLGRTVRDTLNLIHELAERKIGVRNPAFGGRAPTGGEWREPARTTMACVPVTHRNGRGSTQIAFTKGGHGVGVRRLLASSPAPAGHIAPRETLRSPTR
jgi:Resolvase, N terminal domain